MHRKKNTAMADEDENASGSEEEIEQARRVFVVPV